MQAGAARQEDPVEAVRAIRGDPPPRAVPDRGGRTCSAATDVADVGAALSRVTDATLEATLEVAGRSVREQRGLDRAPTRIAVVAMGRYGGFELSYGSDADVLFVHEPVDGADAEATPYAMAVANELRALLIAPASDPALDRRRRPAAGGQAGAAGAHPGRRMPPTTPSGRRSGRPRPCCAPTPSSATRTCAPGSRR